jgi:hypothetical protein
MGNTSSVEEPPSKDILGAVVPIIIKGKKVLAKVDTGADRSSISRKLAKKLGLPKEKRKVLVRSANGITRRSITKTQVIINNRTINATFTIAERKEMKYKILLGVNILKNKFLVDVSK